VQAINTDPAFPKNNISTLLAYFRKPVLVSFQLNDFFFISLKMHENPLYYYKQLLQ